MYSIWTDVSNFVCGGPGESHRKDPHPLPLSNTNPASTPSTRVTPTVSSPPPTHHHHQAQAAGSLPHLTPCCTYWAWLITGAQLQLWPPHLPPHWWDCPIWDLIIGNFRGVGGASSLCCFMPKRHRCRGRKNKTSAIRVKC